MIAIAYAPALHEAYIQFYKRAAKAGAKNLFLIDPALATDVSGSNRDFAMTPSVMVEIIRSLGIFDTVSILDAATTLDPKAEYYIHRHAIAQSVVNQLIPKAKITWDDAFLRWDMPRALTQVPVDGKTTTDAEHRKYIKLAQAEAAKSPDFFRQVGAVAVRDGKVIASGFNRPMPDLDTTYIQGDPAVWREAGKDIQISKFIHAEQVLIASAENPKLTGADLYLTVFPCPVCANLVAVARFKRVFFAEGYSNLDAQEVLAAYGVEPIRVEM